MAGKQRQSTAQRGLGGGGHDALRGSFIVWTKLETSRLRSAGGVSVDAEE